MRFDDCRRDAARLRLRALRPLSFPACRLTPRPLTHLRWAHLPQERTSHA
ncbi:hypothetical protein GCM10010442_39150 [Kitasatospora kifunensis]